MYSCFYVFMYVCFYVFMYKTTSKFCKHEWILDFEKSCFFVYLFIGSLIHPIHTILAYFVDSKGKTPNLCKASASTSTFNAIYSSFLTEMSSHVPHKKKHFLTWHRILNWICWIHFSRATKCLNYKNSYRNELVLPRIYFKWSEYWVP